MGFDLKDFGATIIVGAYVLFGADLIVYWLFGRNFSSAIIRKTRFDRTTLFAIATAASFAIGMLAEDLSSKFVDEIGPYQELGLLTAEDDIRARALFGKNPCEKLRPLAREMARFHLISLYGGAKYSGDTVGTEFEKLILATDKLCIEPVSDANPVTPENLGKVASRIYYEAKNRVFQEGNYYDEMRRIQIRVDFARSVAVVSLAFGIIVTPIALLVRLLPLRRFVRFKAVAWLFELTQGGVFVGRNDAIRRTSGLIVLFLVFYWCGQLAFADEELEFDLRAFGYFKTLPIDTLVKRSTASAAMVDPVPFQGISGMAQLAEKEHFVVVHDTKSDRIFPRMGVISTGSFGLAYQPLAVEWMPSSEPSNDLESICNLPGRANEFLAAESGSDENKPLRMFHVALSRDGVRWTSLFKGIVEFPKSALHTPDNIEGLVCLPADKNKVMIIFGERGGSAKNPKGKLIWGLLDVGAHVLAVSGKADFSTPASDWRDPATKRDIADMFVDETGTLWIVSTQDRGDDGPFQSIIYRAGRVTKDRNRPVDLDLPPRAIWRFDGIKVEAMAGPVIEDSVLSIGTDDENYGGIWRPLFRR